MRKKNEARHSYRITVTNIFLLLFSLLLIPAVISIFFPIVFKINLLITAFFIFLFIIEILILFTIKKPEVSSEKNIYKFSLNRDEKLTFKLISPSFLLRSRFKIEMPASFKDMENICKIGFSKGENDLTMDFKSSERRDFEISNVIIRITIFGLCELQFKQKCNFTIKVMPDIKALNDFIKFNKLDKYSNQGLKKNRIISEGTEFESLREYVPGDDASKIDYKASARSKTPVVRTFTREHNNEVSIIIDSGRLMNTEYKNISYLDYCLNSVIIFCWTALKNGDTINIAVFSNKLQSEICGLKGKKSIALIREFCASIRPSYEETDYAEICRYVLNNRKKRNYVLMFTDISENYPELTLKQLKLIQKKHQLFMVLFQNAIINEEVAKLPLTIKEMYVNTAAKEIYLSRHETMLRLARFGIKSTEVKPDMTAAAALNSYNNFRRV